MTKSKKFFIFLLIVTFIGSAVYIYSSLKTAKAYTFTVPNITLRDINDKIKNTINSAKSAINSLIEKKVESAAQESSKNFKQNAFEFVKGNMNSGIDVIGKAIGADIKEKNTSTNQTQQQNCQTQ